MLLRGTSLHAVTERWKFQVDTDFDELMDLELELQDGVKMVRDALEGYLTKESYLWALSTVREVPSVRAGVFPPPLPMSTCWAQSPSRCQATLPGVMCSIPRQAAERRTQIWRVSR